MREDELEAAEALFRNPPSASIDRELALRVLAYARELKRHVIVAHENSPSVLVPPAPVAVEAAPTPPAAPAAKRKAVK